MRLLGLMNGFDGWACLIHDTHMMGEATVVITQAIRHSYFLLRTRHQRWMERDTIIPQKVI